MGWSLSDDGGMNWMLGLMDIIPLPQYKYMWYTDAVTTLCGLHRKTVNNTFSPPGWRKTRIEQHNNCFEVYKTKTRYVCLYSQWSVLGEACNVYRVKFSFYHTPPQIMRTRESMSQSASQLFNGISKYQWMPMVAIDTYCGWLTDLSLFLWYFHSK